MSCVVGAGYDTPVMMLCLARYACAAADARRSVQYGLGFRAPTSNELALPVPPAAPLPR